MLGAVAFLTPLEIALISPAAALAGVALGTAGTAYLDLSRERRAAKGAHDQAVAELLTATVDLITGIQAVRGAYQSHTRWRHYIRVSAMVVAAFGSTMTIGETISRELLDWRRASPAFERILAADRDLDDTQRRTALDVATVVSPRATRFYAAVTILTLGPDKQIANAVRDVADAVGELLEALGAKEKEYARTRDRVGNALTAFRTVVDRRRH
jgi:hypothetical protein